MIDINDVLTAVPEAQILRTGPTRFTRASIDTRTVAGGELFFAIAGARDGHDYAAAALAAGAGGIVITHDHRDRHHPDLESGTVIRVPDTLEALQNVAAAVRQRSNAAVVAVTGSAGKTTAKALISHVLASTTTVLSNPASFNNHLGVPLTLTDIQPEHTHVVAEIGTNHPGEIGHLAGLVAPDVAVITNVGFAHLGNFDGNQEALAREKTDLLRRTRLSGTWILNGDDTLLCSTAAGLPEAATATTVRVGFEPGNDLQAVDVIVDEHGTRGRILVDGHAFPFWLRATGRHFAYAAMLAVAVARVYGISATDSLHALAGIEPPAGRASLRRVNGQLLLIDDSYNGSPDAMLSSLDLLSSLPGTVKIAVLGQMGELGTASEHLHERVGVSAARSATHLITVGAGAAPLQAGAVAHGLTRQRIHTASSATDAFALAQEILDRAPDQSAVVLVKGSRFTHMERVDLGFKGHPITCLLSTCSLYINCVDCSQLDATARRPPVRLPLTAPSLA